MLALPLLLCGLLGGEQVLDDFRYGDATAARAAWTAGEATPPADVVSEAGRPVLRLAAPFAAQPGLRRAVADRAEKLDLRRPAGFVLETAVDDLHSFSTLTLYFRSGNGWYASDTPIEKAGWQTLRFAKARFRIEGTPAGWDQIDGVRLSAWRPPGKGAKDTAIRFRRLAAVWHGLAVVVPANAAAGQQGEIAVAHQTAQTVATMLEELALDADLLDEDAVAAGALGQRRIAVLPYNPTLGARCAETLMQWVASGGKLLVCYSLSPRLGEALGFGRAKYVAQRRAGQFAEMRFDAALAGLPKSVRQASWNITSAEPVGPGTRVIARWFDDAGDPTGYPAVLLSDRGAFLSHIVLIDDYDGEKRLLAALLGHLEPALWRQMAEARLYQSGRVGHCASGEALAAYLTDKPAAGEDSARAREALRRASEQVARGEYSAACESADAAHAAFVQAYLRAADSPAREARAVWNHTGMGAYPGNWDRSASLLAENGFNMVLPNMLWGGAAHYASDVLPRSPEFYKYGDQIEQCCAAAKRHGIEVHVWKVNYNLATAPKDFVARLRREGRTQVTVDGKPFDWLCPSHPENRKLELESMLEVARKYPVDGLHFDYIRYPGPECCYCDGCRQRFEAESGRPVTDWPKECHSGGRKQEYNDWRCRQITALVAAVSREAKKLRPGLKISAAVFGSYPDCRQWVAQDWPAWIKAGYLDFVCPMDYTESDAAFIGLVQSQMKLAEGRVPVYAGIGATSSGSTLAPDRVVGQIHLARSLGAAGFVIFNFEPRTAAAIVPAVGLGAGGRPAVPSHRDH